MLLLLTAPAPPSALADPVRALELRIGGRAPQRLTLDEINRLPVTEAEMPVPEGHGTNRTRYAGVLLWTLLQQAGLEGVRPRDRVRQVVKITGQDGYAAVLALGEIDPTFEGKQVLVATTADGRPIGIGSLRLVVPGDRRGGRSVRDVAQVEVN
jgi:hypothetical protein